MPLGFAALQQFDLSDRSHLVHADQVQHQAGGRPPGVQAGATGASDPVNVDFRVGRHVDVDDGRQAGDVEAARGDIGRHQHRAALVGKAHQHLVALALLEFPIQREGAEALLLQRHHEPAALGFGIAESQCAGRTEMIEQQADRVAALAVVHLVPALLDLAARVLGRDLHRDRVAHELRCELGDAIGIGGRKEQGLAHCRALPGYGDDVVEETHVQHAVGFVEHQRVERVELQAGAFEVVHHAARCADHDMRAMLQGGELAAQRHTATQSHHLDIVVRPRQPSNFGRDLVGQLACRAQHQCLDRKTARVEVGKQRERKRSSLAAAGLGLGDQVLAE